MDFFWLEQSECQDVERVGGKVANLSRLAMAQRIPPGFCLPTVTFEKWAENQNDKLIQQEVESTIRDAYASLATRCQSAEPRVAVRSSAVDEDSLDTSFAGLFETYLNIVGAESVIQAVYNCWESAYATRVQAYREHQGQSADPIRLAVLVQELVAADTSAVVFSVNPITRDPNEIMINVSWGLGESIVGGTVTPDTIIVDKASLTPLKYEVANKSRMTILAANGVQEVSVPRPMRSQPSVTEHQAIEMAQLAHTLEQVMGQAVDIECSYVDNKLYLLQCRPITTLG